MLYPPQLVLMPIDFVNDNKDRFIKMDGSLIDKNKIPKDLVDSCIFTTCNYHNCLDDVDNYALSSTVDNPETLFNMYNDKGSKVINTDSPYTVDLVLKDKSKKLTCIGIEIIDNVEDKSIPEEIEIYGLDTNHWVRLLDPIKITNCTNVHCLDWSDKVNQILPCIGFRLVVTKWTETPKINSTPIFLIKYKFKEDNDLLKTCNIDTPENYVYVLDLSAYIKASANIGNGLENKIMTLLKKYITITKEISDTDDENQFLSDIVTFFSKCIADTNKRIESIEDKESYGDMTLIDVSDNDEHNVLYTRSLLFQEVIVIGDKYKDKQVTINLTENPSDGDSIRVISMRKDGGKVAITTGENYKVHTSINGNMCSGNTITLINYGSSMRLIYFKGNWFGVIN